MLSDDAYIEMTDLYNLVEDGCPWPAGMSKARAAHLMKDPNKAGCPIAYRVLLIMSMPYRRWASIRVKDMAPWIATWGMADMFAGAGSQGAEDAWLSVALDGELDELEGKQYCGGAADIVKCFDQISRVLL